MAIVAFSSPGSGNWLCPAGVTAVLAECWGAGGGGTAGTGTATGAAGGGGEYGAQTVSVTPGKLYAWTVGTGGTAGGTQGSNGGTSTFRGDFTLVAGHGGIRGGSTRAGGSGSSNDTHHNGGNGAASQAGVPGGPGGGGSAGASGAGGNGSLSAGGGASGAGGSAGSGGGAVGGAGGSFAVGIGNPGNNGLAPGSGGGGAAEFGSPGGAGAPGRVQLTYAAVTQPVIPIFTAGFAPLNSDFDGWIQAPLSFLTSKVVFRAERTTSQSLTSNVAAVIAFDNIIEDPFAGWQSGSSSWLCPAGYSGIYSVTLTVSCGPNGTGPVLSARVGIDNSAFVQTVDKAWVPGTTGQPGIASGSALVQLFGGQDSVQGIAFLAGANSNLFATAGQRCEITIEWVSL